jgi:hypothetical protein
MSYTYQPAERMYNVLQAVLAELRGMPIDSRGGYRPTIPARRGSTNMEGIETPSFTKRRNIARMGSRHSIHRDHPTNITLDVNIDPLLSSASLRKHRDSDIERSNDFVMITPRSEIGSWQGGMTDTAGMEVTGPATASLLAESSASTWIGTDLDTHDISHLASVHFPELRDMPSIGEGGELGNPSSLDFLNFTAPGDEWKEWRPNDGAGDPDLDGFTSTGGFGNGLPGTPGRFENRLTPFAAGI